MYKIIISCQWLKEHLVAETTNLRQSQLRVFVKRALGVYNLMTENIIKRRDENGGGGRRGFEEGG